MGELSVLTWNLFHGRAVPGAGRSLLDEFAARLAGWRWDVALLQEVPPWWAEPLAQACEARSAVRLTSRNWAMAVRRRVAEREPDFIKSNGGGANVVLCRRPVGRTEHLRLRTWPERRVAQLVRLSDGPLVVNYHGSSRVGLAEDELARLWDVALRQAGGAPIVLGGDLNLRSPRAPHGALHVAMRDVDHLFALGLGPRAESRVLERGELSDHPPLLACLAV